MTLRAGSILVTLLWLAALAPAALAQDGDKKAKSDEASEEGGEGEGGEGAEGGDAAADVGEPDPWERPPTEEEKPPPKEAPKPKEEKIGDGNNIELGLLLGWGFKTDRRNGGLGADPYTLGFGLSGGYTLDFQLYVGAYFLYFIGSSEEGGVARVAGVSGESTANYMNFGVEAGYDAWISGVLIRPSLHLGVGMALFEIVGESDQVSDFALGPGLRAIVPLDDFFLGGDIRGHIVTGDGVSAVGVWAVAGLRMK